MDAWTTTDVEFVRAALVVIGDWLRSLAFAAWVFLGWCIARVWWGRRAVKLHGSRGLIE